MTEENLHTEGLASGPDVSGNKEPSSFRLVFTLGLAGLFSGLVMAGAYLMTKPRIEANKAAAVERAIFKVLPHCATFKTLELRDGQLIEYVEQKKQPAAKTEAPELVYMGYDSAQQIVGFAIKGSEIGFADVISVMIGYDAVQKIIIGYEVLDSKETPGLGDKIFKDAAFRNNFVELATEPEILFARKGEKQKPNEVEAITGATISSKAIIRLLNKSLTQWKEPIANFIETQSSTGEEQKQ